MRRGVWGAECHSDAMGTAAAVWPAWVQPICRDRARMHRARAVQQQGPLRSTWARPQARRAWEATAAGRRGCSTHPLLVGGRHGGHPRGGGHPKAAHAVHRAGRPAAMLELGRGPLGGLGRWGSAVGEPGGPGRAAPPLLGLPSCWMARRSWAPGAGGAGDACWGGRRRCWGRTRGRGGARAAELGEWAHRAVWALLRAPGRCSVLAVGAGARGRVQFGGGRPGTPPRRQCTATIARSRPGALPAPQEGPRSDRGPPGSAAVPAQPHPHSRPSAHPAPCSPCSPSNRPTALQAASRSAEGWRPPH